MTTQQIDAREIARILSNPLVRSICEGVEDLPVAPRVYQELSAAVNNPRASLGDVGRVIASDPGICATVLSLVNGAFFGPRQRCVSIQQAVGYLGLDLLKGLVMSAHLQRTSKMNVRGFSIEEFQAHALRIARLAHNFVPGEHADNAFTAGLLVEVGQLVLAAKEPALFEECLAVARDAGRPLHEIEKERIGVTHGEVGAFLLDSWGIPLILVECVAFHHRPGWVVDGVLEVRAAVHAADVLVRVYEGRERDDRLDVGMLHRAGYLEHLDRWRSLVAEDYQASFAA